MATSRKQEIITFKADPSLLEAMKGVPNRSAFIRHAILAALDNVCPLCAGTGILTPQQKTHVQRFMADHDLETCDDCEAVHLVCNAHGEHEHEHEHGGAHRHSHASEG